MSVKNKARDRLPGGRLKSYRRVGSHFASCARWFDKSPSWYRNMMMTRPERREVRSLLNQVSNFVTTETGVNNSPTLIKRDVTTEVSLADGDIILLGGLAEQKDSKASSGWSFFGSRTSESNKTDIMVMLQVRKVDRSRATPRSAARSGELFRDNLN